MRKIQDRILVAEDHRSTRHFLQRILESWDFEVVAVEDGEAALKILESDEAPELAILDWIMPKLDGVEVCAAIRQRANLPYIYMILLTALTKKRDITSGLAAGADDFVSKPFVAGELRARVRAGQRVVALERAHQRRARELQQALADVKMLKQLVPICRHCQNVRDDEDYWRQIEKYSHSATGADFSHGGCPDCEAKRRARSRS